ncbi:hypothetical protein PENTCL1PPCAC_26722, partial [Pristionchus entomophagus]
QDKPAKTEETFDLDDFEEVHPVKGLFLKELSALVARREALRHINKYRSMINLMHTSSRVHLHNGMRCSIDQLGLTSPSILPLPYSITRR